MAGYPRLTRRSFLAAGGVVGASLVLPMSAAAAAPGLVRAGRPVITHGVQAGDVSAASAIVWTRADREARMRVEVSTTPNFSGARSVAGPVVTSASDLTGKMQLRGLPAGRDVFYRVTLSDPDDGSLTSEPVVGHFRTAPLTRSDIRFVWSADLAGQGWGIDESRGGYRIFDAMREREPHFFVCSGDTIYADGPLPAERPLSDGTVWRNIVTEEKSKVAETLAEYRGNFRYNLLDANLRRFNAEVAQINQWDDHEVINNWYPGEVLNDPRYTEQRVDVLAERARQAFHEYLPIAPQNAEDGRIYRVRRYGPLLDVFVVDMRSYKDANTSGQESTVDGGVFGRTQLEWLKRELAASRATWKVIAADLPLSLIVKDGDAAFEAIGQGDPGEPRGRELEVADLLSFAKRNRVTGMVWITADVHYAAAHHYHPSRAEFTDFDPFWEFVAGPLNAVVATTANALDPTFGPEVVFQKLAPSTDVNNPAFGYQFFGEVAIDADTEVMTVQLRDVGGAVLHSVDLEPGR